MTDPSAQFRGVIPAYWGEFDLRRLSSFQCDVLVIGSGIAGTSAALAAAEAGAHVIVLCKAAPNETNTHYAQGGVASVLDPADSAEAHIADTLRVGQGLCEPDIVRQVVTEGGMAVRRLREYGASFDLDARGQLALSREAGHSAARIVHARGDSTGAEIQRCLLERVARDERIDVLDGVFVRDLLVEDGAARGVLAFERNRGMFAVWAENIILATGGAGQIYRETTNPPVATGDGMSLALRAGAILRDLEFVQFHPTTLYIAGAARFLISEVVRGAGAVLRDRRGRRFMPEFHPDAELAPRDVVSRAILRTMVETRDTFVYLDLSGIRGDVRQMFPGIARICSSFDIDIARDPIPVRPGCHYFIGGVRVDAEGRSSVARLFACGEAASSGLHGANRLASNSLLEGLVFGRRAGLAAAAERQGTIRALRWTQRRAERADMVEPRIQVDDMLYSLKALMWLNVGIERAEAQLLEARERLEFWCRYLFRSRLELPAAWQLANMILVSSLITECALLRRESRGTHFRRDHPNVDEHLGEAHSEIRLGAGGRIEAHLVPRH